MNDERHVIGPRVHHASEVTRVRAFELLYGDLDVLLRHRPPSISARSTLRQMASAELSRRCREGGPLPTAVRDGRTAAAPVLRGSTRRRRVRGSARESQAAIVAEFRLRVI